MDKVKHYTLEAIACLLTLGLFYVLKDGGITKYIVLLGISVLLFLYGFRNFEKEFLILGLPSVIYIVIGLALALIFGNFSFQSIKETAFAIVPLIAAISFYVASKKVGIDLIKWQYWAMIALTLPWLRYYYIEDVLETQYAFIFGVFLLYFCIVKQNIKYILFTTLMLYLMNKRIAMLAAVLMLVLYEVILYVTKQKPEWKKKILQYLSLSIILLFVGYVFFLCVANLEGQFLQDLTSGRSPAWEAVKEQYQLLPLWLGKGLGDVVNLLGVLQYPNYTTNLHNDLLKVFIEIGTLGYVIWLASHFVVCYWISKRRNLGFRKSLFLYLVMIYTLLNYTTDNIMVYVNYWLPAFLVILTVIFSNDAGELEESADNKKEQKILLGVILACGVCVLADVAFVYLDYRNPSKFTIPDDAAEIYSPVQSLRATVWVREGQLYYRIRYSGENVIEPSELGIETTDYLIKDNVVIDEILFGDMITEEAAMTDTKDPVGKAYQPVVIRMQQDGYEIEFEIRVYDTAVAFRYILSEGTEEYEELTQMRFLEGSTLNIYDETTGIEITDLSTKDLEKTVYGFPFTAQYEDGTKLTISEICEENQSASYVTKARWKQRTLEVEQRILGKVNENDNIKTPWRVFEINNPR